MEKKKKKIGRPTTYNEKIAKEICDTIATTSTGLKRLCNAMDHWPEESVIYEWLDKHEEFNQQYTRARRRQAQYLVDEIIDISDDKTNDDTFNRQGEIIPNNEWMGRSRLKVDTRKWIASKVLPKVYGEARDVKADVEEVIANLTLEQKKKILLSMSVEDQVSVVKQIIEQHKPA